MLVVWLHCNGFGKQPYTENKNSLTLYRGLYVHIILNNMNDITKGNAVSN